MQLFIRLLVAIMCVVAAGFAQQPNSTTPYDDFGGRWLDNSKWQATNICTFNALDCVREIRSGKLHLLVRSFGNINSDPGVNWSENTLDFIYPNAVTSITADVTVRDYSGIGCPSNIIDLSGTQVRMGGTFFNLGTADAIDDVQAWFIIAVDAGSSTMSVGGWSNQYGWANIGSYPLGTPLRATIKWDPANDRFIVSARDQNGVGAQAFMPYNVSDGAPPSSANKRLSAAAIVPNCTEVQTMSSVEATFDNVIINK